MYEVNKYVNGLGGSDIDEKVSRFNAASAGIVLESIVLPIVCMKLFGDLGQELLTIYNELIFASNDRPSAARYILLKLIFDKIKNGGGGYFPNDSKNRFYI